MKKQSLEIGKMRRYFDTRFTVDRMDVLSATTEPLLSSSCEERGTLVLDLDETLVYIKCARGCLFNCSCGEGDDFYLAKRPGVDSFLRALVELNLELVLWTASPQPYADAALRILDPQGGVFSHRLYRQHLVGGMKDLSRLGRHPSSIIAVDDSLARYPQPMLANVMRIKRYIGDGSEEQEHDTSLAKVEHVLRQISSRARAGGGTSLQQQLAQVERDALDDIAGVASSKQPWRPSWSKKRAEVVGVEQSSVCISMPVYVPSATECPEECTPTPGVVLC